jgi:hypothetical protein
MTLQEVVADELYQYLVAFGPAVTTTDGLAAAIGRTTGQVNNALAWIRRDSSVAANGWTIPYQQAGRSAHEWRVIDTTTRWATADEQDALNLSRMVKGADIRSRIDGWLTQVNFTVAAIQPTAKNRAEIRVWQNFAAVLNGARAMVDQGAT